jgi:hypothetical protein
MGEHAFIDEDDFSAIFEGNVDLSFEFFERNVVRILSDSSFLLDMYDRFYLDAFFFCKVCGCWSC